MTEAGELQDEQLLRYSRQIMLTQIDVAGQLRLRRARALVIGLGGLGSPVAMYLAAAGVGELTLADHDRVDLSNLQRQLLHRTADIGARKTESARARVLELNPEVRTRLVGERLAGQTLEAEAARADIVVDATDNFASRFAINRVCARLRKPLVSGAAARFEGQVGVFDTRRPDSPCYRCLYPQEAADRRLSCDEAGVVAPLLGIIGSVQALETMKVLMDIGRPLYGRLLLLDALRMEWQCLRLPRDPDCPDCGARPPPAAEPEEA